MKFFFHDFEILFQKKSTEIFQEAKCVSRNIIQFFFHTLKFHSYDHDNISFIERINNFHRYYSFKSCLKIFKKRSQLCCYRLEEKSKLKDSSSSQLFFKDFSKLLNEFAMFIRDRRNTNLNKNIVMPAIVTMNSTLDNAGVLDPLLKFIFKN